MTATVLLLLVTLSWLGLLFWVARLGDGTGWMRRLSTRPWIHALSLGIYATSWTFLGAVGLARTQGLTFLAVSLGPLLSAMLVPAVWLPLLRILRRHQLASVADLFAFRYRSQAAGVLVTLVLVAGVVPYLAVQIRSVARTSTVLVPGLERPLVGFVFCAVMVVFAALFGARHAQARERNPGLVVAMALESIIKAVALLAVGAAVAWQFGLAPPDARATEAMVEPVREGTFITVLLLSIAAPFLLPRQFHMAFTEAPEGEAGERALRTTTWAFPAFLLVLNLPLPLVLWAGERLFPDGDADVYTLTVVQHLRPLDFFAWLGGVSASSAMVIVDGLALSSMTLTHLVLPLRTPGADLYAWLRTGRRVAITGFLAVAFLVFLALEGQGGRGGTLASVGLVSFAAILQLVPGLVGVLFLPRITREGIQVGLVLGGVSWLLLLALPLANLSLVPLPAGLAGDPLGAGALLSLTANVLGTAFGSMGVRQSAAERAAAAQCRSEMAPMALGLLPRDVEGFVDRLSGVVGRAAARVEVEQVLSRLGLSRTERRPDRLEEVRIALEAQLTGLIGPVLAHAALSAEPPPGQREGVIPVAERLQRLEALVRDAGPLASPAETLRAWLSSVFTSLPVGVVVQGPDGAVVWANRALESLAGEPLAPNERLADRVAVALATDGEHRWGEDRVWRVSSASLTPSPVLPSGRVVVVEDLTERRQLEARVMHQERLAAIGQLAAGVAHEVGNPLAAILMVVQNLQREGGLARDIEERLSLVVSEALRIDGIIKSLLTFGRAGERPASQVQPVSLSRVVRSAVTLARLARRRDFTVSLPAEDPVMLGVESELVQVVVNLLNNACDATPADRPISVSARGGPEGVELVVADEGAGMSEDTRRHLFEPFFTTKGPGRGTGLGMSIIEGIVTAHHGEVEVESAPGAGTRVSLRFPAPA